MTPATILLTATNIATAYMLIGFIICAYRLRRGREVILWRDAILWLTDIIGVLIIIAFCNREDFDD